MRRSNGFGVSLDEVSKCGYYSSWKPRCKKKNIFFGGVQWCQMALQSTKSQKESELIKFPCKNERSVLSLHTRKTVVVAQQVELQIVVLAVVGSSPIDHPLKPIALVIGFFYA